MEQDAASDADKPLYVFGVHPGADGLCVLNKTNAPTSLRETHGMHGSGATLQPPLAGVSERTLGIVAAAYIVG